MLIICIVLTLIFSALSMLDNITQTCPYPFRYNAEYRKAESERVYKDESENEDDIERNSSGPLSQSDESEGDDMSSLEADQDGYYFCV